MTDKHQTSIAGLARRLSGMGAVKNITENSFQINIDRTEPSKWITVKAANHEIVHALQRIESGGTSQIWNSDVDESEAAIRLLTVHLEEVLYTLPAGKDRVSMVDGQIVS